MTRPPTPARRALLVVLAVSAAVAGPAFALEQRAQEALVLRVENITNIDAPDSELSLFLSRIHREGATIPAVSSVVGPLLKNPYLTGLPDDAWLEGVLIVPVGPGPLSWVWVFPVDHQDDYLASMIRLGLSDTESSGGMSVLSSIDPEGNIDRSYLDWLPGNIAVFGAERDAVRTACQIYEAEGAAQGLLGSRRGREIAPDVAVRFLPPRLAAWQDEEAGVYWWRQSVTGLGAELIGFWDPETPRARLIAQLADDAASLPMAWPRLDVGVWFGEDSVDWRIELAGGSGRQGPVSDLTAMRRLPAETAEAYALALDRQDLTELLDFCGRLLLGAAGGAVPTGARDAAATFARLLTQAGPRQLAAAWLPLETGDPVLGSTRLLLTEWERPELLDAAWLVLDAALNADGPVVTALGQLGWKTRLEIDPEAPGAGNLIIEAIDGRAEQPYYSAGFAFRRAGPWLAAAWGKADSPDEQTRILGHRAGLAEAMLAASGPGSADARQAFTLVDSEGATGIIAFSPIRFLQTILAEAADWRILSPDDAEPASTRQAREMFEYEDSGGAWVAAGTRRGAWTANARMSWHSLEALAAALGIAENSPTAAEWEDDLAP